MMFKDTDIKVLRMEVDYFHTPMTHALPMASRKLLNDGMK